MRSCCPIGRRANIQHTVTLENAHWGTAVPCGMSWGYLEIDPVSPEAYANGRTTKQNSLCYVNVVTLEDPARPPIHKSDDHQTTCKM